MSESLTRLHVSPFDPDLLPVILGSNSSKSAQNISYHSLQTFPEKSYGYVDLPSMEAEKVKKKLNGAILKGQKIKVEDARPKKRRHGGVGESETVATEETPPRRSKRAKKEHDAMSGHELSPDRKVKRGWTEPKVEQVKHRKKDANEKKKQQASSKFTEKEELLFKTRIPKNKKPSSSKVAKKKKDKSDTDIIHEFENNTAVPSFLRDSKVSESKTALEYEDGKGWVDKDGTVIEEESGTVSRKRQEVKSEIPVRDSRPSRTSKAEPDPRSPPSSSEDPTTTDEDDDEEELPAKVPDSDDETSSSGSSDEAESSETDNTEEAKSNNITQKPSINTTAPPTTATTMPTPEQEVHPLEALFKKPTLPQPTASAQSATPIPRKPGTRSRRPTLELDTKFTFFGSPQNGGDDDISENENNDNIKVKDTPQPIPMTPFSTQDYRSRSLRSAAPTPDTAMPGRSLGFSFNVGGNPASSPSPISSSSSSPSSSARLPSKSKSNPTADHSDTTTQQQQQVKDNDSQGGKGDLPQSEFERKFWEKRGENNRAWKARRRAVLKENRQRENRARRPKAW